MRLNTLLIAVLLVACAGGAFAQTFTDPNSEFVVDTFTSPGYGTVALDFGPGGLLYVAEKRGRVMVYQRDGSGNYPGAPTVFADLTSFVDYTAESGLLGLALDPDFATNRWMYLFYSTPTDQRLVRVEAAANYLTMTGGQTTILSGLPQVAVFHNAGDIAFHPHDPDHIYIALGDDAAISHAPTVSRYEGKFLKINKLTGDGVNTNPFWTGTATDVASRVWAVGFRNPFRFCFHPTRTDEVMYISENGGPNGMTGNLQDRVCWVQPGADGNWNPTSAQAGDGSAFFNPVNQQGRECLVMHRDQSSLIGIAVTDSIAFADPAHPTSDTLFISNWIRHSGCIWRFRLTGADQNSVEPFPADAGGPWVTSLNAAAMKVGPDGWLYFVQTNGDESAGGWYRVGRIRRVAGLPPVASFNASTTQGEAPLNVQFTDTSTDPDGTVVAWEWDFGDGNDSTDQNPQHTFTTPGVYTVTLTVWDNSGLTNQTDTDITVTQTLALTLTGTVFDGRALPAAGLATGTELRLYQSNGTTPLTFAGGTGPNNNGISVPAGGAFNNTVNVQVSGTRVVVRAGETGGFAPQRVAFDVPQSGTHSQALEFHLSDTAVWGRVTTTGGAPAVVDVGVARAQPSSLYAFAGGRDYLPASQIPATGVAHRTVTDVQGYYYVPVLTGDGGAVFFLDVVADTGSGSYFANTASATVNGATRIDVTLGVISSGGGDDLSGIAETPNVNYETQIQPIWTAQCAGCHNDVGGSAGLTLAAGESYAALVNVSSAQVGGMLLVQPGAADLSYLFEKINHNVPQVGVRMRPGSIMDPAQQALIRDWINQGALESTSGGAGSGSSSGGGCSTGEGPQTWAWIAGLLAAGTLALCVRRRTA